MDKKAELKRMRRKGAMMDKKAELKRMWRLGVSLREIASALGISRSSAQRYASKLKLGRHPSSTKRVRMTDATRAKIKEMREGGASLIEISKVFGFSFSTISETCKPDDKKRQRGAARPVPDAPSPRPPKRRLELRDAMYALPYPPALALMGDPQPGRRELLEQYA